MQQYTHEHFMKIALMEAEEAYKAGEIPIGAILVDKHQRIIARGHNQVEQLTDPTAHAEMICLSAGFEYLNAKYLKDCTIYITLEPCTMCAGALFWSQIGQVVYGATDEKRGKIHPYILAQKEIPYFHPKTKVIAGVLEKDCGEIISRFFQSKRN